MRIERGGIVFAALAILALASCKPEAGGKLEPVGQQRTDMLHAACIKSGGNYIRQGSGDAFYCLNATRDAGKTCSASSDCQSGCLARSRTCAPVKPLLGCNAVLTGEGMEVMQCVE